MCIVDRLCRLISIATHYASTIVEMSFIWRNKMIDMLGQKFGRLTVIKYSHFEKRNHYWLCKCDCGKEKIVRRSRLLDGNTKSCGCLRDEGNVKHGVWSRDKRLYKSWNTMIQRCENIKNTHFVDYGGRGIKVCDKWHNPVVFEKWALENGYKKGLTIERIDVNGNYCPENCKWASMKEQCRNKRNTHFITINGVKKCLADWLKYFNISNGCFHRRIEFGWDEITALKTPSKRRKTI